MKTERETDFDKIKIKVLVGDKMDATFSIKGGVYKFSSKGLTDREHELLSKGYNAFVHNKDIRLPPSIKFNMIENLIHGHDNLSSLVRGFTEDNLSASGQFVPVNALPVTKGKQRMERNVNKEVKKTTREIMDRIKTERAPAQSSAAKYVYPEGMSQDEKRKFRAKARAEARKQTAD